MRSIFKCTLSLIFLLYFSVFSVNADTSVYPILDEFALQNGKNGVPNIDPCDNFYQFACGEWLESVDIPLDTYEVSHSASALIDENQKKLTAILEGLVQDDSSLETKSSKKLADFYISCINFENNNEENTLFLKNKFQELSKIQNHTDLTKIIAEMHLIGLNPFFGFAADQDSINSNKIIGTLYQSGMSLPEPKNYFEIDTKSKQTRKEYLRHISNMYQILGYNKNEAEYRSKKVLKIETALAVKAYSKEQEQDPLSIYHITSIPDLEEQVPHFDWKTYFSSIGFKKTSVNLQEPEFFQHLEQIITKTPFEEISIYLEWIYLKTLASSINHEFENESFRFWKQYLLGIKEMQPQSTKCTQIVASYLDYAFAEVYVRTIDVSLIKHKTEEIVQEIKSAFRKNLNTLLDEQDAWFDQNTQIAAIQKLDLMKYKIGAPEKWKDYSNLQIDEKNFLLNLNKIKYFHYKNDLARIDTIPDPSHWIVMPWVFNAFYHFSTNEFFLPFGILQPPMLDLTASDGANFGPLGGGTIGHEIIHGFDSNGKNMDAYGNLRNWWTEQTEISFAERSQCFIKQAESYNVAEVNLNVDGTLTLAENLADQGGVKLGYLALVDKLKQAHNTDSLWLNKYNQKQQFWIAYAQSWCTKKTPESLRIQMLTDEHAPSEFRVNGVLMNRPEFADDFQCKKGSKMAPQAHCSIW